jgi:hypothetical protein
MPILLIALVLLAAIALGIAWFMRANPSTVARRLRIALVLLGGIGVGGLLIFGVRFLPSFLPELFGLGGVLLTGLIARALRHRPARGFSTPGSGQRTETRTAFLEAWIDHATGDIGGRVLQGRFGGRLLESLADAELLVLQAECAADPDSARILEAYLDRRLGPDWRQTQQRPSAAPPPTGTMTRAEALAVLGLAEGASEEEIRATHRRLIQRVHPDVGGSADLAARINRAKDILLGG